MKAMILTSIDITVDSTPGSIPVVFASNSCYSMGIEVVYQAVTTTIPTAVTLNQLISDMGVDLVICPTFTGTTRTTYARFTNGDIDVPVIVNGIQTTLTVQGISGYSASGSTGVFAKGKLVKTNADIMTNGRRFTLSAAVLPAITSALITGEGSEIAEVTAWKYSPDGVNYVYWCASDNRFMTLHIMVQAAIDDGLLSAGDIKPAPIFMNIDHINDGGDGLTDGGFQNQPSRLNDVAAVLRSAGGVCYASLEKSWINGTNGTVSGELLTNLRANSDVFKYIACHDHDVPYTLGIGVNDAIDNQETKANIDASYQATKTAIESLGLTVNNDFAHCALNAFGTNFIELAQPYTDHTADAANTTSKAGYGFRAMRAGASITNSESYPSLHIPGTGVPAIHFLNRPTIFRGITYMPSFDAGSVNGAVVDLTKDYIAFLNLLLSLSCGVIGYLHGADFEDPALNGDNLISDGTAFSRGLLQYQYGAALQIACPDTVNFGADVTSYVSIPPSTTVI